MQFIKRNTKVAPTVGSILSFQEQQYTVKEVHRIDDFTFELDISKVSSGEASGDSAMTILWPNRTYKVTKVPNASLGLQENNNSLPILERKIPRALDLHKRSLFDQDTDPSTAKATTDDYIEAFENA